MQRALHSQKDYYTTWIIAIHQTHVQSLLICYFFKKSGKNFGKVIRVMDDTTKDKWCVIFCPHLPLCVLIICPRATGNDTSQILKPPYVKTTFLPTIITFWKLTGPLLINADYFKRLSNKLAHSDPTIVNALSMEVFLVWDPSPCPLHYFSLFFWKIGFRYPTNAHSWKNS